MATIANQYDPNNPNGANTGGSGTVMPSTSGGGTPSAGGGTPSGGGPSSSGSSTPYQPPNVSQYLSANQGAGQQLTQGITKNVQNQADQVNNTLGQNQSNLDTQYNSLNQNLGQNGQQTIQTAFKDPQALLDSYNAAKTNTTNQPLSDQQQTQANQYNDFQKLNTGGYNNDIQAYGSQGQQATNQLQNQLGTLTQQTNSANNEMGRNQLLQNAVGQGNYNQGQQTLDSLFLQNSPGQANTGGLSNLQQLQKNLGGIGKQATQQVQGFGGDIQSKLAALQGLSAQDQSSIKNLFLNGNDQGAGLNQIGQNVQNEYDTTKANAAAQQQNLAGAVKNGQTLTPEQLSQLGLSSGTHTYGLNDLSSYLTPNQLGTGAAGNAQVATPEEFARYNALNQLAGGANGLAANNIFSGQTAAGGYKPVSFDTSKFNQDVAAKQQALTGSDFKNHLLSALSNFGYTPSNGTSFGAPVSGGQDSAPLINSLAQGLSNNTLTPEQANQMVAQYQQHIQGYNPIDVTDFNQAISPFTSYYNNTYSPEMAQVLGQTSADATSQPNFNNITRPQGK